MKLILSLILATITLASCSTGSSAPAPADVGVVKFMASNEEQRWLVTAAGADNFLGFEAQLPPKNSAKQVELWLDHYQKGQFKEEVGRLNLPLDEPPQKIKFYLASIQVNPEQGEMLWTLSLQSSNLNGESMATFKSPLTVMKNLGKIIGPLPDQPLIINQTVDLGVISLDEASSTYLTDTEETIKQNSEAFILRAKLS